MSGPLPVCSRHLLTRFQHPEFVLVFAHVSTILQLAMNQRIQFASGFIIGRDYQRPFWMSRILAGYCAHPLLVINDLVHTALLVETRYSSENVSAGELLHRLFQARVLLAHNLTQLGRLHARFLQLLIWPARFNRLMLPRIANQKNSV